MHFNAGHLPALTSKLIQYYTKVKSVQAAGKPISRINRPSSTLFKAGVKVLREKAMIKVVSLRFIVLLPQDLLHLSPSCQLINQLVKIPYLANQGILYLLNPVTANQPGDEMCISVQ